ncbi:MAG: WG repeat-containing protein [Defluviitaleaceae bacterium]|nr:WG repeat-containing protein [Defluviitaleaceae bacterium]
MRKTRTFLAFLVAVMVITGLAPYNIGASANSPGSDMLWEWVVPPRFAHANPFENGFAVVSYGELAILPGGEVADFPLRGLIDINGNLVVPMEYHWFGVMDGVLRASRHMYHRESDPDRLSGWMPGGTPVVFRTWTVEADGRRTLYIPDDNRFDWIWEEFIPNSFFHFETRTIKDRATGEVLIPTEAGIDLPFSRGFATAFRYGKRGLIDANNDVIIPFEFDYIWPFIDDQQLSADVPPAWEAVSGNSVTRGIARDGKWGLINNRGEFVVDLIYDYVEDRWGTRGVAEFINGMAPVSQNGKWGVIDVMGNIIVPIEFAGASTWSGLAAVRNDAGLYGAFDSTGRLVVPFEYDAILGFNSDRIFVRKDGLIGFLNMEGEAITEKIFDDTFGFFGDFAAVSRGGRWGFINKSGEVVIPLIFDAAWGFTEGIATVQTDGKWGFARPLSDPTPSAMALVNTDMGDTRFINLQIDNPFANNNAIITQIDEEDYNIVPVIERDRTLVPLRFISEKFGGEVDWDEARQKVTIKKDSMVIELFIGQNQAYVNGEDIYIDVAPTIRNDRTFVPIRFVSEVMGFRVDWREKDRVVEIQQEAR